MVYEKYRQEYASAANDSRVAVRKMIGFFMVSPFADMAGRWCHACGVVNGAEAPKIMALYA